MASDDPVDPRFKELLDQFERHIRNDADLEHLKAIRRQIRTALPMSVRRYLPAYLLQEAAGAGVPRAAGAPRVADAPPAAGGPDRPAAADRTPARPSARAGGPDRGDRPAKGEPAPAASAAAAAPAPAREARSRDAGPPREAGAAPQADGEMARLFVSVGRSRRISRQMLTDLFVAKLELPHDRIGEVKILDNFSFIEVPSGIAQAAIDKISGETLNGRRVNVDFARSKKT